MSWRRQLSFAVDERQLLEYYDKNGKSDIAKKALSFYIKHSDNNFVKEITSELLNKLQVKYSYKPTEKNLSQVKNKIMKLAK